MNKPRHERRNQSIVALVERRRDWKRVAFEKGISYANLRVILHRYRNSLCITCVLDIGLRTR